MYDEDALLPISALQHLLFCERQCALIHIERLWAENRLTTEGRHLHDKVHGGPDETRGGRDDRIRIARGVPLRSLTFGLAGVADVVEFHISPDGRGPPRPFPVEYKHGRQKANDCDRIQLCAQALCLEEMLGVAVPAGALFYGRPRRRTDVTFGADLRRRTEQAAARLHTLIAGGQTPAATYERKCERCSLLHACLPEVSASRRSVAGYIERALHRGDRALAGEEEFP